MQPIPTPQILDPDRVLGNDRGDFTVDHESRANLLDEALRDTCAYAEQLWQHLDAIRCYLYDSLPSDPRAPGTHPHIGASPTGPGDDEGWQLWIDTFATVTSILAGPHGDSGFGLGEARLAARKRREAPNLAVLARTRTPDNIDADATSGEDRNPPSGSSKPAHRPADQKPASSADLWRIAGLGMLALLAFRGLRPHRNNT